VDDRTAAFDSLERPSVASLIGEYPISGLGDNLTFKPVKAVISHGLTRITAILASFERKQLRNKKRFE